MTNEEYAMLRSIAAADCTEGPNFDPALLTELLDVFLNVEFLMRTIDARNDEIDILRRERRAAEKALDELRRSA